MSKRPQFSLKVLFIIIVVLAVPLGMMVSGNVVLSVVGYHALFLAGGASLGYTAGGRKIAFCGVVLGIYLALVLTPYLEDWWSDCSSTYQPQP